MLRRNTIQTAIQLAEEFDRRQLVLEAQSGTPLAELNQIFTLSQFEVKTETARKDYQPDADYLHGLSTNWGGESRGEEILHTTQLDAFTTQIASAVQQHLKFAKTVVKPLIVELVDQVKQDMSTIEIDPYNGIQIATYELPSPLTEPSLFDALSKFKNAVQLPDLKHMGFAEKPVQEILDLLLTGSDSVDARIREWAAQKGEAFFEQVWTSVFTALPTQDSFISLKQREDGLDVCLAVYLLCAKLHDTPPEGMAMSLGNYNTMLYEFKSNAALKLLYAFEEYQAYEKTGLLIKNYHPKRILVVGSVYKKWLQEGGQQAHVLAATLLEHPPLHVAQLNEQSLALQARWNRYLAMVQTTETNKRFVRYKEILQQRTLKVVQANLKDCYASFKVEEAQIAQLPEYRQFQDRLETFVQTVSDKDFDNLWELGRRVICETVFFYTDAGKILKGIEEACIANPKLSVSEAAYLSLITYVTDYCCDQISLKSA